MAPSSNGLGRHPFTVEIRVRIPLGSPISFQLTKLHNNNFKL